MRKEVSEENFDIREVIKTLKKDRAGFTLEGDLQFCMGMAVKKRYKNVKVIMEHKFPNDNDEDNKHIDMLVRFSDNKVIPIELKYKHQGCKIKIFNDDTQKYELSNQSCRKTIRVAYLEDIKRIETYLQESNNSNIGYAILVTNYSKFEYYEYDTCTLNHDNTSETKPNSNALKTKKDYPMEWLEDEYTFPYAKDEKFLVLVTTIKK